MKAKLALKVRDETAYNEYQEEEEDEQMMQERSKRKIKEPIESPWYQGKFEDNRPAHLRTN